MCTECEAEAAVKVNNNVRSVEITAMAQWKEVTAKAASVVAVWKLISS